MSVTVEVIWEPGDLHALDEHVDAWLRDLVGDTVEHAASSFVDRAPGRIRDFVTSDPPQLDRGSVIEGVAGVTPDPLEGFVSKRGSRRADFPLYVDVGTGLFGEHQRPITSFPPNLMGPIELGGEMVYLSQTRGQPAQDYSGEATRDTDAWLDSHIEHSMSRLKDF